MSVRFSCPVCRARFRATAVCSRCGADLGHLMRLLGQAHRLRVAARAALVAGQWQYAVDLAESAQTIHCTRSGRSLLAVAETMAYVTPDA